MWWWPAAVFVAFSNEDVTPGARAFAVAAIFFGLVFFTLWSPQTGAGLALPGTLLTVGVLQVVHPVPVPGTDPEGPVTPRGSGVGIVLAGVLLAVYSLF
ncbi:hypothetical protein M0R89_18910 (plasmid) [Halorussus limi]|uniref:Uncharacterized protein n=1 Tax=Halorussus limi TaxID=2938695 RepID=A0A8U0HZS3_9EURY|nr:hypothetical protein [Halorussus limi]UPV76605.1 hypothetical protein M0R89_18910 [Halorussus limi]